MLAQLSGPLCVSPDEMLLCSANTEGAFMSPVYTSQSDSYPTFLKGMKEEGCKMVSVRKGYRSA